jgi:hypothetical protein
MPRPALARAPGAPDAGATRLQPAPPPPAAAGISGRAIAGRALAIGIVAFGAVAIAWGRTMGPDTYISLTAGRLIFAHGLPYTEHLTVGAAGRPWIDQQWLAHVIFYALWKVGGNPAVAASSALAIGAAIALLYALCMRRGADPVAAWLGSGAALVICLMFAETRAQSFAYPLFVGLLWIVLRELDRGRFSPRALWIVPIIVVWANIHGSVLVGAAMVAACFGVRALMTAIRRNWRSAAGDAAVALLAVASVLVTPYGSAIVAYYPRVLGDPALATISEWQPSSFNVINLPFVALLMGTLGAACFARGRGLRLQWWPIAIAAVLAALATHALRYQVWFGVSAAPALAAIITQLRGRSADTGPMPRRIAIPALALMVAATLGVVAALATTPTSRYEGFVSQSAVATAARYADAHPAVRVLGDDSTGSALLWQHPELAGRVGFDARTEIYPPKRFITFASFLVVAGRNWTAATHGYQELAITCWLHPGLCPAVEHLKAWRVLSTRDGGLVAVRRSSTA